MVKFWITIAITQSIFLDEKIKPWLIEINSLASFATDSPLDKKIKYDVIYETIAMLNLS